MIRFVDAIKAMQEAARRFVKECYDAGVGLAETQRQTGELFNIWISTSVYYKSNPEWDEWKRRVDKEYFSNLTPEQIEQRNQYKCEYRQNTPEKIIKEYNPERVKEQKRKYRQNSPERVKEYNHKCYRRARGLPEDWDLSQESSIEVIMKRWLQESEIEFIQQYHINLERANYTKVDFFIPEANVCLYCDGDYWHGPKRPDIQERDARINRALESGGYIVIRFSESDILAGVRPTEILELIQ